MAKTQELYTLNLEKDFSDNLVDLFAVLGYEVEKYNYFRVHLGGVNVEIEYRMTGSAELPREAEKIVFKFLDGCKIIRRAIPIRNRRIELEKVLAKAIEMQQLYTEFQECLKQQQRQVNQKPSKRLLNREWN